MAEGRRSQGSAWSTGIADASLPGKDSTSPRCPGASLRSHRALPSDHVITIMSSSAISRARLRWVNEDTAVQLLDAEQLDNNLADLVARQAETQPLAGALVQPMPVRRAMTWAELDRRIDAVAAGLSAHGLVAGHRIASSVRTASNSSWPTSRPCAPATSPCRSIRSPQRTNCAADQRLRRTGAVHAAAQPLESVHQVDPTPQGLDELSEAAAEPVSSPRDPEALAVLLYTAGTSGSRRRRCSATAHC